MYRLALKCSCVLIFVTILLYSADRLVRTPDMASAQMAIQLIPVATGLSAPAFVTGARDGSNRLFILEVGGAIKILMPGATDPLSTPFLDLVAIGVPGGL